jgi:transposase
MKKIREIIRMHGIARLSQRQIALALNISRPVVSDYIRKFEKTNLKYENIQDMSDENILKIIKGDHETEDKRNNELASKFEHYTKELKRVGVTRNSLWEEYIREYPDGYSYPHFCYHLRIWQKNNRVTMHIDHKAGDKMFVDFTGKKMNIVDRATGEITEVEIFVGVLGASQLTYVEATLSQKKEDWIKANENALMFFEGAPNAIVPDCLKSGVTKGNKYEPEINPEYLDFARHYDTTILPARPHKPKDKALAENAVKIVYAWIFAPLRDRIFFSLKELNKAIREELIRYNSKAMQKLKLSRRELFNEIEKSELKPLPAGKYEFKKFAKAKVQINYHIYLGEDKHYYSVPYRYAGKCLELIYTGSSVEIFHSHSRIAFYKRDRRPHKYTTQKEHMPSHHKWVAEWNPERIIKWADNIGGHTKNIIKIVLNKKTHPEQGYKVCLGILSLAKKYGNKRVNQACKRALYYEYYSYRGVKNILENGMENLQEEKSYSRSLPEHENIRGNYYYN